MLQVGLYFITIIIIIIIITAITIIVMKQACLKCIDCCFEIGDKSFFFFLMYVQGHFFIIWFVKHWTGVSFPTFPSWEMYLTDITAQKTPASTDVSSQMKRILPGSCTGGRVTQTWPNKSREKFRKKKKKVLRAVYGFCVVGSIN